MTISQVRYTPAAAEAIRPLHPNVKRAAAREAIRGLSSDPLSGHPLAFELTGFRSLRVSRYRVINRIQGRVVEIHLVGPRRDVYELFRQFLERAWKS